MPTYNVSGWIWAGLGSPTTLLPVTITDDDPNMSPYFTNDFGETLTINGTTYTNPRGGTYQLSFTDSDGAGHTEDFLLWYTGSNFVFVPMPGSAIDSGSSVTALGGWQEWVPGFVWEDVVCFTAGTEIVTPIGPRPVETLDLGDLVLTQDNGIQAVRWIGRKVVSACTQAEMPHLQPVRILAGAFGPGVPERDVLLSPQHRVVYGGASRRLRHGSSEVLVPAKGLIDGKTVRLDGHLTEVEYIHILFDSHQVVFAHGLGCESFQPGDAGLEAIDDGPRTELLALFPELQFGSALYGPSVRPALSVRETRTLLAQ